MRNQLNGKRVLVIGAGGGIGSSVCAVLQGYGARIAAADLTNPNTPGAEVSLACDVTSADSLESAVQSVVDSFGGLDSLAFISGTIHEASPIESFPLDEWDRVFDINVKGIARALRYVVPVMKRNPGGSIVTIGSWYGQSAHAYFSAYCASKAAVISLTQSSADELAQFGIRVNSISPGNIDTAMHRTALATEADKRGISFEEMKDIEWGKIPLKVAGPPESIAEGVAFLVSDASSYITGATLDINGGVMLR